MTNSRNSRKKPRMAKRCEASTSSLAHKVRKSQHEKVPPNMTSLNRLHTDIAEIVPSKKVKKEDLKRFNKNRLEKIGSHKNFSSICLESTSGFEKGQ